jgi:hypothetical protein
MKLKLSNLNVVTVLISAAVILIAIQAILLSQHATISFSLNPLCHEFKVKMPQTVDEAAKKYGVTEDRIELYNYKDCPPDIYWGSYIKEGPAVTVTVPVGGEILVYRTDGEVGESGSIYSGQVTAKKFIVFGRKLDDK